LNSELKAEVLNTVSEVLKNCKFEIKDKINKEIIIIKDVR
jgi:hypothetical protein